MKIVKNNEKPQEVFVVKKSGKLEGEVKIRGAKNAALPILAACILAEKPVVLEDVPILDDIRTMIEILRFLDIEIHSDGHVLTIDTNNIKNRAIPYELTGKMRASTVVLGPLMSRFHRAELALPGGCVIGLRPIDLHLKGLRAMGAEVDDETGVIRAKAKSLKGNKIYMDFPSVGATQNLMMAAVLAEGETQLDNAAMEPEITDLANILNKLGADVKGAGTSTIRINGVKKLGGAIHQIIPDRIEAGTIMVASAMSRGLVRVNNIIASHLKPVIAKLIEAGAKVIEDGTSIVVEGTKNLKAIDVKTMPHPGFPTDMQAQMMAMLSFIKGKSVVTETVFEDRFRHVAELKKMGARIEVKGHVAEITGVDRLQGTEVCATDLRAGAALILAGMVAEGETIIRDIPHIDRGYERIEDTLSSLGVNIVRSI